MVIDAHHHFWRYSAEEYGWIDDSMSRIARDFLPDDLRQATLATGVEAVISVQARQSLEETRWLLEVAEHDSLVAGVVGWAPLADPEIRRVLDEISHPKLVGLRHVVQDEPDDFLLGDAFNRGVATLAGRGLAYDLLIFERQLPAALSFVDRHPEQRIVLDHLAKPQASIGALEPWRTRLRQLAKRPHIACKVSGLATEADWNTWTRDRLRPYLDVCLEAFGPGRLMFGSDWPVCLMACEYAQWKSIIEDWAAPLSDGEKASLFGATAQAWYRLGPEPC